MFKYSFIYMLHMLPVHMFIVVMNMCHTMLSFNNVLYVIIIFLIYGIKMIWKLNIILTYTSLVSVFELGVSSTIKWIFITSDVHLPWHAILASRKTKQSGWPFHVFTSSQVY